MSKPKIIPLTDAELSAGVDQTEIALQIDDHLKTVAEDTNQDPDGVRYAMFICLARALATLGWTADELCDDVRYHVASQLSAGSA
jgi:hypothetical protein